MFCTKFKLSADRMQLLKVITGLGFNLRHWHKLFVEVYCLSMHDDPYHKLNNCVCFQKICLTDKVLLMHVNPELLYGIHVYT